VGFELTVGILTFLSVILIGGALLVVRAGRRRALESRLYGGGTVSAGFASSGTQTRLAEALEHVGRAVSTKAPASDLRLKLAHAGYFDPNAPTIFIGAQLMLVVLAIPLGGIVALATRLSLLPALCVVVTVVAIFAYLPNVFVSARKSQRRMEVRQQLPDAIDLLEICVSSGMGLDMAWNAVADEFRGVSSILADEMSLCTLEIHLGAPRAVALRNMAERTGVEDISSLVATLVQSERFGTSISQALRIYADAMRTERSQRAEEAAEKLTIKLLFPMVVFIFPVLFLVILGPAGIKIYDTFAKRHIAPNAVSTQNK
jgi:tight adherence protein C